MSKSTRSRKRPYSNDDSQPNESSQQQQNVSKLLIMENRRQVQNSQTCIAIFPEELWEIILDRMDDSKDIQNVLAAFPKLSNLLHGRKPNWYIDQAFPHIFKQLFRYVDTEDLLALRRVSKRWCNITENFLRNDPFYHPYNHNGINRRNIPYGQFNCIEVHTLWPELRGTEMIERRYEQILHHPRNPFFIGRLCISSQLIPHEPFLEASLVFLKTYGHYISSFEFTVDLSPNLKFNVVVGHPERLFGKIFECISHTARVKYLKTNLVFDDDNLLDIIENLFTPEYAKNIPELPHLETLILEEESYTDNGSLTNAFSVASWITRLKRLEVPLYTNMFHNNKTFPNLFELSIKINNDHVNLDFDKLNFLNKDDYPLLRKLSFTSVGKVNVSINKLFSLLARLQIEEMQLLGECTIANDRKPKLLSVPSIKYFRVRDSKKHNFEFLKKFTSLEYLYLNHDSDEPTEQKKSRARNNRRKDRGFSSQLRMYIYELEIPKNVNIWKALPTVKFIGVEMQDMLWQYSRECGNKRFRTKLMDYDD